MKISRRGAVRTLIAAALLAGGLPALAQSAGKDYVPIQPAQPTDNPTKIEVIEFFSYGCPHCSDFNPLVSAWAAKLPADVVFRKVPVTFGRAAWSNIARLYYTLEATGDLARLDGEVFKAIHAERANLFEEKSLTEWVVKKGVDPRKFADAFSSFGVMSKVKRGDQMAQSFRVQGVPALAIEGKYLIGDKSFQDTLAIADQIIVKARSEKSGKK